jgi:transmembrane sensor
VKIGVDDNQEDAAVRWALRLDGGPLAVEDEAALDAWLAADERRRGALLRAEAALAYLDRARALSDAGHDEGEEASETDIDPASNSNVTHLRVGRRAFLVGGSTAALSAASVLAVLFGRLQSVEIRTGIGEVRRVSLADGSIASVNTATRVSVALSQERRQVRLEDGEAWFQVAHDKARPFIVEAGDVRVQAVGTAFSVRRREGGADVLVTEGVVEAWVAGHENERTRISAGSKTFVVDATPSMEVVAAPADIDRQLAWRNGELALNGESLAYAASELNRYNRRKVVIDNGALGREPLVGYFRTDQPENFGRAVAGMVGAHVTVEGNTIRLMR